jgi:hypothetical protein
MKEEWKAIEGSPYYEVSNKGRVRSHDRLINGRIYKGKMLKGNINSPSGHLMVNMAGRREYIHRLVLESFVGECPPGLECRHLNGRATDNRLENLAWGTALENHEDRRVHNGGTHPRSKLTPAQVLTIREEIGSSSQRALASKYGVSLRTIQLIVHRLTWKHI